MTEAEKIAPPPPVEVPRPKPARPPVLFTKTQRLVAQIEEHIGRPFLAYWNSPNGSVCQNDVVGFNEILDFIGHKEHVGLFIKSSGGNGKASLRIVHMLHHYAQRFTALVPLDCVSAATMLALGAEEIHMGPLAYLSAVDTSLTHDLSPVDKDNDLVSVNQNELSRIIKLWKEEVREGDRNPYKTLFEHVHPLVVGAVDRVSSLSHRLCTEILSYHMKDPKKVKRISETLNTDYPSHAYPITSREAERLGLAVQPLDPVVNDLLIELNGLYSEMGQRSITDYDERNYHNNEILNILEGRGIQVYYQIDKDWHYRTEDRRWISLNDESSWRRVESVNGKTRRSVFHIR